MQIRAASWLGLLVWLAPDVVRAEWLQASSAHFVIYANDDERSIRTFSQQLERFHSALVFVTDTRLPKPSPSNRVTVYVVNSTKQVRRLYSGGDQDVAGFYRPGAGNSIAVVSSITAQTVSPDFSMIVLLHEYAHHFMYSTSSFPMPRWYSEGTAEFFASASFARDGGIGIGQPAQHRAGEFLFARDVKVSDLLDPETYEKSRKYVRDAFYGKSWLLFHYLTFSEQRRGQLQRYLQLLSEGRNSRDAGHEAFGDFNKLEHDLDTYLNKPRMLMLKLAPEKLETGPIEMRRLSAGEAAMMSVSIRSRRGVNKQQAEALLPEARAIATRFPEDPAVLTALSEAEHDAGNDKESIAAADAALSRDPSQVNAYVQKGLSLFRMAASDPDPANAYVQARAPFIALNRLENDHPLPLIYYYLSFVREGKEPTQVALNGLQRSVQLAPFDLSLRMMLATQQIRNRQFAQARRNLGPIAYNPHGGRLAAAAKRVLVRMESNPEWDGKDVDALVSGENPDDSVDAPQ